MRLFAIGDSLTQGFMSGAAAKANQSYVKLVADVLGAAPFDVCDDWPRGGMPLNFEDLLRVLEKRFGTDISGPIEWPLAMQAINGYLDSLEDYWERGDGREDRKYSRPSHFFHNSAIWGYRIADAWNLNAELARKLIAKDEGTQGDGWFALPSAPFYRTTNRLLNPQQLPECDQLSALDWLQEHVQNTPLSGNNGGVENLILWLGNNNVLGTALSLQPKQTTEVYGQLPHQLSHEEREAQDWNLWHPEHFEAEYRELIKRVDASMTQNPADVDWKVFIANVPHVTIIPLVKGLGEQYAISRQNRQGDSINRTYFKYYGYFFLEEKDIHSGWNYLTLQDALFIDDSIDAFNHSIDVIIDEYNTKHGTQRYYLVDINDVLSKLAWKRNNGMPTYQLPDAVKFGYPPVNTKYYNAAYNGKQNVLKDGGLFSLDGVHPTAIGQGVLASEFLKVMGHAGVNKTVGGPVSAADLHWKKSAVAPVDGIIDTDTLYQNPIALVKEFYQHNELLDLLKRFGQLF